MRRFAFIWILAVVAAPVFARGEVIRVATYNVENYLVMDRWVDEQEQWRPNYPKPESEKEALRRVIHSVAPDVLALQEMGPEPFLTELQTDLKREGLYYPYSHVLRAHDEARHVAILSRLPLAEVVPHTDADFPYFDGRETIKRGLLEVRFDTAGEEWVLFTLHLKSKWTERDDDPQAARKRVGEATAARNRILERVDPESGDLFVIAGDFNDTRDTATLRRFLQRGAVEIAVPVEAADSRGQFWTQHWERQHLYSRIDFILASPEMSRRVVPGAYGVYDGEDSEAASDHRMVWADFRIGGSGVAGVE